MEALELVVITCGFLSAVLGLLACASTAKGFPKKSVVKGFEGAATWAQIELNGSSLTASLIVNESELAIKSQFPSIGLILNLEELVTIKEKAFIGSRVKVTSTDLYVTHMFREMIISNRAARQLSIKSKGAFKYVSV